MSLIPEYRNGNKLLVYPLFIIGLIFLFTAPGRSLNLAVRQVNDGEYFDISLDICKWDISGKSVRFEGSSGLHETGLPDLPVVKKWITVPEWVDSVEFLGADFKWSEPVRCTIEKFKGDELDGVPLQSTRKFKRNGSFFRGRPIIQRIREGGAWCGKPVISGGNKIVPVIIVPLKYDRDRRLLQPALRMSLHFQLVGDGSFTNAPDKSSGRRNVNETGTGHDVCLNLVDEITVSGISLDMIKMDPLPGYLVITGSQLAGSMNLHKFLTWKRETGLRTFLATVDTIGYSPNEIKDFVAMKYRDGFKYLLLVGDVDIVPSFDGWQSASDYWYGCVDGEDDMIDLSVGRISVSGVYELGDQLNRIIEYQQGKSAGTWLNSIALVADKENYPRKYTACKDSVRNAIYGAGDFTFDTVYGGEGKVDSDLDRIFLNGTGIVNYRGHGSYTEWYNWGADDVPYSVEDLEMLPSTDKYPVCFSITCYTGNIDYRWGQCFAEVFMSAQGGGVGILAASGATWTGANNMLDRKIFEYLLASPGVEVMKAVRAAEEYSILMEGTEGMDNAKDYLWLGDPAMFVWTTIPSDMRIDAPVTVRMENPEFTIRIENRKTGEPVAGAKVVVLNGFGDTIIKTVISDEYGEALIKIPSVNSPQTLRISVTNPGYRPAFHRIRISEGLDPLIEEIFCKDTGSRYPEL